METVIHTPNAAVISASKIPPGNNSFKSCLFPKVSCKQKNTITSFVQKGVNYMRKNRVKKVSAIIGE